MIHDHSHKYLYQLSSWCEQKLIGKKQHIYERKSHETKMADFNLRGVRQTRTQALDLSGKNVRLSGPPHQRTFLKTTRNTLGQKQYLAGEVGENFLMQV